MRMLPFGIGWIGLCAAALAAPLQLERQGDLYSLEAREAALDDVLAAIDAAEPAKLTFYTGGSTQRVTGTFTRLPLERLLDALGVSYALSYSTDASGTPVLDDARLLGSDAPPAVAELDAAALAALRENIDSLRHDDRHMNAIRARWEIEKLGCAAAPFLEAVLRSDDHQQRYVAAGILMHACPGSEPGAELLDAAADLLRSDTYADDWYGLMWIGEGYSFLRDQTGGVRRLESRLAANLDSDDGMERFLSALLLAEHGVARLAHRIAPILLAHLEDNNLKGDATLAAYALYRLGAAAKPYVEARRDSADPQQADVVRLLLHQWANPADTNAVIRDFWFNTHNRNPLLNRPGFAAGHWCSDCFPDAQGVYAPPAEEEDHGAVEDSP